MTLRDALIKAQENKPKDVIPGTFCDCHGTLLPEHKRLVQYLNIRHAQGQIVKIISSQPEAVMPALELIGLHPDLLLRVHNKDLYRLKVVEELIDDTPSESIRATRIWHPYEKPFIRHMNDVIGMNRHLLAPASRTP